MWGEFPGWDPVIFRCPRETVHGAPGMLGNWSEACHECGDDGIESGECRLWKYKKNYLVYNGCVGGMPGQSGRPTTPSPDPKKTTRRTWTVLLADKNDDDVREEFSGTIREKLSF
jgi:hypothetical protein